MEILIDKIFSRITSSIIVILFIATLLFIPILFLETIAFLLFNDSFITSVLHPMFA